ncbi:MAG: hypothetical protein ACTSQM_02870 [Candidatus Odinarchaeia archaeon]
MVIALNARETFIHHFKDVLEEAKCYEHKCFSGKRWGGNPLLIIVDAALDSIGLSYFNIVVPRVKKKKKEILRKFNITSFKDFYSLPPDLLEFRKIMNNERVWYVATKICEELYGFMKEHQLKDDFTALRRWAEEADYHKWKNDRIGRIKGVGLITFQYLRMQVGVDTTMPDRIIEQIAEKVLGVKADNHIAFIEEMERYSREIGFSQILICWAIWLKYSDKSKVSKVTD